MRLPILTQNVVFCLPFHSLVGGQTGQPISETIGSQWFRSSTEFIRGNFASVKRGKMGCQLRRGCKVLVNSSISLRYQV